MIDSNISKFPLLNPSGLAAVTGDMEQHLLQYPNEVADYHSHLQQGMDSESLLQSALLTLPPYEHQAFVHGMIMSDHERTSAEALMTTSTHPHSSLYNPHITQTHPLSIFPQPSLSQFSVQQSSPITPQTPNHNFVQHSVLPLSHPDPQSLASTQRQPPTPLRPVPNSTSFELTQSPHSQSNSPEQSPPGPRPDRLGRLGSHSGVGRRIILAPGSSAGGGVSIPNGVTITGAAGQNHAAKDSCGKFLCKHCPKTYLHLKHLKRHLLRHTGDRPYQCVLCKDTFSRSDILKRHFQKCCIRRGNPSNLTHLAHAHDHQRKKTKSREQAATFNSPTAPPETYTPREPAVLDAATLVPSASGNLRRVPRSCSQCIGSKISCDGISPCAGCRHIGVQCIYLGDVLRRQSTAKDIEAQDLFNFATPPHPAQIQAYHQTPITIRSSPPYTPVTESAYMGMDDTQGLSFGDEFSFQQQVRLQHKLSPTQEDALEARSQSEANSVLIAQSDQPLVYYPTSVSSQSPPSHTPDLDWTFPDSDGYYPSVSPSTTIQSQPSSSTNLYSYANTPLTTTSLSLVDNGIASWNVSIPHVDPFQAKCEHLRSLLFPDPNCRLNTPESPSSQNGDTVLSDDSDLKEWMTPHHVQNFIESFCTNFQSHFPVLHLATFEFNSAHDGFALSIICHGAAYSDRGITVEQVRRLMERCLRVFDQYEPKGYDTEYDRVYSNAELQTRLMFASICTWHGNEHQRERSRKNMGKLIDMARTSSLFKPLTPHEAGPGGWSYYHQTDESLNLSPEWNWLAWVEQEKRNRVMFGIFLLHCAHVIYFNERPRLELFDLKLTLPADDAPWDATTAEECYDHLGLNGPKASMGNTTGTRKAKQPELSTLLKEILTIGKDFRAGTTNAYGKFILIHAIHVYIWQKQREFGLGQWDFHYPDSNQRVTAQQKNLEITRFNQTLGQALEKWKKAWDADLISQFGGTNRRSGFYKDGIAFYWLAVLFTRQKKRDLILKDVRDRQVILQVQRMLETANRMPMPYTDSEAGAASCIDENYGVDELAFDLKLLLAPVEKNPKTDGIKSHT